MSNPMQDLHTLGLNPFAVTLLAESMLKSAYVKNCGTKPLTFEFPVRRSDSEGWAGVRITIEAVPVPAPAGAAGTKPTPEQFRAAMVDEGWPAPSGVSVAGKVVTVRQRGASTTEDIIDADGMGPSAGARPLSEWHEDDGPVTWWKFPVDEPAWIGTPNSSDWPGYHTHWTPHPPMPLGVKGEGNG